MQKHRKSKATNFGRLTLPNRTLSTVPHPELQNWARACIAEDRDRIAELLAVCGHSEAADLLRAFNLKDTEVASRRPAKTGGFVQRNYR